MTYPRLILKVIIKEKGKLMARHGRYHKLLHRSVIGPGYSRQTDFPLRDTLVRYALNLLGNHPLTTSLLAFVLTILPEESKSYIMDSINAKQAAGGRIETPESCSDCMSTARCFMHAVKNRETDVTLREAELMLRDRILEAGPKDVLLREVPVMRELQELFDLNGCEIELVAFCYCYEQSPAFESLCDELPPSEVIGLAALATGAARPALKQALRPGGRLMQSGILEGIPSGRYWNYSLADSISACLSGISDKSLTEKYVRKDCGARYRIDTFPVDRETTAILRALLSSGSPCSILLHGIPGTGKTEFAKSIARSSGRECCFFSNGGGDEKPPNLKISLRIATKTPAASRAVLVIDEADWLLNTDYVFLSSREQVGKGWITRLVDETEIPLIWISNDVSRVDRSILRRFAYSVHFSGFGIRQRERAWRLMARKSPLRGYFTGRVVRELSEQYEVNAGGIGSVLRTLEKMADPGDRAQIDRLLPKLLSNHVETVTGQKYRHSPSIGSRYDIRALNTDPDIAGVLDALIRFYERFSGRAEPGSGMNLLFWGESGTGKTGFAKYAAGKAGRKLVQKRGSDLLSAYIGETEKRIGAAFEEAEREEAFLLLDEADSFLIKRENALRSWEVTRTNELLTRMESYGGVLICCTNLIHSLDPAAMRRFGWKVEFRPLTAEGKVRLFGRYFPYAMARMGAAEKRRLDGIDGITAGDIHAVWKRNRYPHDDEASVDMLIRQIEEEVRYRRGGRFKANRFQE